MSLRRAMQMSGGNGPRPVNLSLGLRRRALDRLELGAPIQSRVSRSIKIGNLTR